MGKIFFSGKDIFLRIGEKRKGRWWNEKKEELFGC